MTFYIDQVAFPSVIWIYYWIFEYKWWSVIQYFADKFLQKGVTSLETRLNKT